MDEKVELTGRNKDETFLTKLSDIFFIQSAGNYIQIGHKTETGLRKIMLRNTISGVRDQLPSEGSIIQCHRAYLVNTRQIREAIGNAQGFKLQLHFTEETIPVSRKYVPKIREKLSARPI